MNYTLLATTGIVILGGGGLVFVLFSTPGEDGQSRLNDMFGRTEFVSPIELSGEVDAAAIASSTPPPKGYTEYRNEQYEFSFYHAPEAQVKEFDEGYGAKTIVLENLEKVRGMQIFIVPYEGTKISEARFRMDVPSGIRENIQPTAVDGVEAVTFTSRDQILGETREVWFIHGGHLFEVTTFRGVTDWFTPIMQSWRFF